MKQIPAILAKYWKIVLIVGLFSIALVSIKTCNEREQRLKDLEKAEHFDDSLFSSRVQVWRDKVGELHSQVDNLHVERFALLHQLDSVSRLLNLSSKQISSISKTASSIEINQPLSVDTVAYVKVPCDDKDSVTVPAAYQINWSDNYMKVWGTVTGGVDSVHVIGVDTLSRVDYWKRKWFLGAKTYYTDYHNANPHIKIVAYKGALIGQKEKKWSVGASLHLGYPLPTLQFNQPVVSVGIGIHYSLIKF